MNSKKLLGIISIGLVGFLSPATMAVASGLAYFQQYYSNIDRIWIQMLLIGPTITSIPACLAAGKLSAKFGHKNMIVVGEVLSVLGGFMPLLFQNFVPILISRFILGIGSGLAGTAVSGVIFCAYEDMRTKANVEAVLQAAGYVGSFVFTIVGGWLSDISWNYCFYAYLLGIPVIIMSLLFTPKEISVREAKKIPLIVPVKSTAMGIILILGAMSGFIALYGNNISGYIINNGFGTALTAGLTTGFLDITGFIGCVVGYAIYRKTDRWILAACSFLCGIVYFFLAGAQTLALVFVVALAFGFLESIKAPLTAIIISEIQPSHTMTSVCGICSLVDCLFRTVVILAFTKCFTSGSSGNERIQFLAGGIGLMIVAVVALVFTLKHKRPRIEDMAR